MDPVMILICSAVVLTVAALILGYLEQNMAGAITFSVFVCVIFFGFAGAMREAPSVEPEDEKPFYRACVEGESPLVLQYERNNLKVYSFRQNCTSEPIYFLMKD